MMADQESPKLVYGGPNSGPATTAVGQQWEAAAAMDAWLSEIVSDGDVTLDAWNAMNGVARG